jgi:hypothetical protein
MSQGRHGLKVLGLSLLTALGLMAVTAGVAQAAEFIHEDMTFSSLNITSEQVEGSIGAGELLVPGLGLKIHCESGHVKNAKVYLGGKAEASVLFLGCKVLENTKCTVYEKELETPGAIEASGVGKLVLHNNKHYLVAESDEFARVFIHGDKCLLPLENLVDGSVALELEKALTLNLKDQPISDISKSDDELLGVQLFFGEELAEIDGGLGTAHLSGTHENDFWGAE